METTSNNNSQATQAAVLMINAQGLMLTAKGQDYFVSYNRLPWMKDAPVSSVLHVCLTGRDTLSWPDLDVDLEIDSLRHPERYPLVMKRSPMESF